MATAQSPGDPFLTCVICTERYTDPCTLSCHHTFCRTCILHYLQAKHDSHNNTAVPCPFCLQTTQISDSGKSLEEWLKTLRPNYLISERMGHSVGENESCFSCKTRDETIPGRYWCPTCQLALCEGCSKAHRKMPLSSDHELYDLSDKVLANVNRKCREHPDSDTKFICQTCNKAACQSCCILYHRQCQSVVTVSSMVSEMSEKLRQNSKDLSIKIKRFTSDVANGKEAIETINNTRDNIKSKIEKFSHSAKALIIAKKEETSLIVDNAADIKVQSLQRLIRKREMAVQLHQQRVSLIAQALEREAQLDLFELCQSVSDEAETQQSLDPSSSVLDITVRSQPEELASALEKSLILQTEGVPDSNSQAKSSQSRFTLTGTVQTTRATDIAILEIGGIVTCVVTDNSSYQVKAFYVKKNGADEYSLSLGGYGWGITKISESRVAVTIPTNKIVVFLLVQPALSVLSWIETANSCYGISRINDVTIAVGSTERIEILALSGNVFKTIQLYSHLRSVCGRFMHTTEQHSLLISESISQSIKKYKTEGNCIGVYGTQDKTSLFQESRGIVTTPSGDILVADFDANKVVMLNEDGDHVADVLTSNDGIFQPSGLALHGGLLYVVQNSGPILIFKSA